MLGVSSVLTGVVLVRQLKPQPLALLLSLFRLLPCFPSKNINTRIMYNDERVSSPNSQKASFHPTVACQTRWTLRSKDILSLYTDISVVYVPVFISLSNLTLNVSKMNVEHFHVWLLLLSFWKHFNILGCIGYHTDLIFGASDIGADGAFFLLRVHLPLPAALVQAHRWPVHGGRSLILWRTKQAHNKTRYSHSLCSAWQ